MKNRKIFFIVAVFLLLILLVPITSQAKISKGLHFTTNKITLKVGNKKKLSLKEKNKNIIWKSSKKKVATVSKNGIVKAIKVGTAKITASFKRAKATCVVKVVDNKVKNSGFTSSQNAIFSNNLYSNSITEDITSTSKPIVAPTPEENGKQVVTPTPVVTPRFPVPSNVPDTVDISLTDGNKYILNEYDTAKLTYNDNGTLTILFDVPYGYVTFFLPDTAETFYSNYKQVTIYYSSEGNDLSHALYDGDTIIYSRDQRLPDVLRDMPEKHPDLKQQITVGSDQTKTFTAGNDFAGECIRGFELVNLNERGSTTITIKKITFK